jgi:3-methyl-2-oxobutanoate hydroxymethyltransferase
MSAQGRDEPSSSGAGNRSAEATAKVTIPGLKARKLAGEKITALTAYDYPSGLLADEAGIELILVGDSLSNTILGYANTLPVTLDEMLTAVRAVRRAVRGALLIGDMPFGSYHTGEASALEAGVAFLKAGAEGVKLEGGTRRAGLVRALVENEIPVLGHIGLTPQSIHAFGGYRIQGTTPENADALVEDALALERAGAFAIVIEGVPSSVAEMITSKVDVPTIGIGAGSSCDGQILVFSDLIGLTRGKKPKFVRQYLDMHSAALQAIQAYRRDVRSGDFPSAAESYEAPAVRTAKG